jgi:hypothetical protein
MLIQAVLIVTSKLKKIKLKKRRISDAENEVFRKLLGLDRDCNGSGQWKILHNENNS